MQLPVTIPLRPAQIQVAEKFLIRDLQKRNTIVASVLLKKIRYGGGELSIMSHAEVETLKIALSDEYGPPELPSAALKMLLTTALDTSFEIREQLAAAP